MNDTEVSLIESKKPTETGEVAVAVAVCSSKSSAESLLPSEPAMRVSEDVFLIKILSV